MWMYNRAVSVEWCLQWEFSKLLERIHSEDSAVEWRLRGGSRGVTRVTGSAAYFMLLLCMWQVISMSFCAPPRAKSWRQTLKFHSPVSPDPVNARSLRSLGFPKSPPLKNPRSANGAVRNPYSRIKTSSTVCSAPECHVRRSWAERRVVSLVLPSRESLQTGQTLSCFFKSVVQLKFITKLK